MRNSMGLDASHDFRARMTLRDELNQTHVRYEHFYRGVRVWESDTIVHTSGRDSTLTGDLRGNVHVGVVPSLSAADARALVHLDLRPMGGYVQEPTAELIIYPEVREQTRPVTLRGPGRELNAEDIERVVVGYTLAYHIHTELENGTLETLHTDYIIDAHTGSILKKWDTLKTAAVTGTGFSQYSGTVPLNTNSITGGWELRDVARGMSYATYNLDHGTSGTGTIYTDTDYTWGVGINYIPGWSTTSAIGQTAAVDAHYGVGRTYDYYKYIHLRDGIDNAGTATYNRVHYGTSYDNAFWSDSCYCMTYGDGASPNKVVTALDVVGHELTHGVTSHTANLSDSGEPGGLDEATSDIHGTMVEFHARGGNLLTIGNFGGNWTFGEQFRTSPRYMYKPSKDGSSPDAWYSSIGSLDVHYSSGPMNRAFYFLSQGSSSSPSSDYYSSYLPGGMTGIGNDHAARIAYRALTVYMTSSTNYAGARTAFLSAASDFYGSPSANYAAVQDAFAAINVGSPAGGGGGNLLRNPGFEIGAADWMNYFGAINNNAANAHSGSWYAYLNGYGTTHTNWIYQDVTIPSTVTSASLSFWLMVSTAETTTTSAYDTLKVQICTTAGTVLATLATYSNLNAGDYSPQTFDVTSYKGQTIRVEFLGVENSSLQTSFFVDDTALTTQ